MAAIMNPVEIYIAHTECCSQCHRAARGRLSGATQEQIDSRKCKIGLEYTRVATNFVMTPEDAS